jgi:hypothetical protein
MKPRKIDIGTGEARTIEAEKAPRKEPEVA